MWCYEFLHLDKKTTEDAALIGVWWEEEEEGVAEDGQGSKESWLEWVVRGWKRLLLGIGRVFAGERKEDCDDKVSAGGIRVPPKTSDHLK